MQACYSRRQWLKTAAAATGAAFTEPLIRRALSAPTQPVAVSRCMTYGPELLPTLDKMFDQLGGLGRIVKGKTVAIKINLTGAPSYRVGYLPCEDTHYTHPRVIAATVHLMSKAGARRIRLLESPWSTADALKSTSCRPTGSRATSSVPADTSNSKTPIFWATRRNTRA